MQVLEIGTDARTDLGCVVVGRFDFEDVGAPVGKLAHRRRSRACASEIDNFETGKRKLVHNSRIIIRQLLRWLTARAERNQARLGWSASWAAGGARMLKIAGATQPDAHERGRRKC